MKRPLIFAVSAFLLLCTGPAHSETAAPSTNPNFDAALASQTGADEYGMRKYVLVILKTGPNRIPDGVERDEMFKGHLANINRLADAGLLAVAGPLDGIDGWRGLFILSVKTIEEAKQLVATDPTIIKGELVAEYHNHYGSAALMLVNATHKKIEKISF